VKILCYGKYITNAPKLTAVLISGNFFLHFLFNSLEGELALRYIAENSRNDTNRSIPYGLINAVHRERKELNKQVGENNERYRGERVPE